MCNDTPCFPLFSPSVDGHSEAEFGMSWCAGFGGSFYSSYFEVSLETKIKTKDSIDSMATVFIAC